MKFKNIQNLDRFFEVVDSCDGKIELVGPDIRLNLKSNLAKIFGLANIFAAGHDVEELEILAYNQEDIDKLIAFMVSGNT